TPSSTASIGAIAELAIPSVEPTKRKEPDMSTVIAEKGNVLRNTRFDHHALVLALTNNGARAKLHIYGQDEPVWHPLAWYEVIEAGDCTCYKCSGSGLYYFGGEILNGVYQGKTGPC